MSSPGLQARLRGRLEGLLGADPWGREPLPRPLAWLRSAVQLGMVIAEGFARDHLVLRAHSLTYLTVLSIVPFLALIVTFAGLLGVDQRVLDLVVGQLAATVPEAQEYLTRWSRNLDFGALGPIMGGLLIGTTVLALGGIEKALNAIWGISQQRPWVRRIPDYLAVLVVAPLLLGIAIPLRVTLESQWAVARLLDTPGIAQLYDLGLSNAPTLLVVAAFSFLYWFMPNTEVRIRSALLGGLVGGLLFSVVQWGYVSLNVGAARYNAIVGGFAAVPLFIVWVFISWAIFLLGAEVVYAHQTLARYRREVQCAPAGPADREAIALGIALACARAFRDGETPWSVEGLSDRLDVPLRTVRDVTEQLAGAGILAPYGGPPQDAFQLGRPAERIRLADLLGTLRGAREVELAEPAVARETCRALDEVDRAAAHVAEARTLADLLAELPDRAASSGTASEAAAVPAPAPRRAPSL